MLIKRLIDVFGSLTLLLLTAPLASVICLAIATTSPGGVFFRQERTGRDGHPFVMLKFRTMRAGADAERAALAARNEANGHLFKLREDPGSPRSGDCCAACRWMNCPN